jgi:hypothetical protein
LAQKITKSSAQALCRPAQIKLRVKLLLTDQAIFYQNGFLDKNVVSSEIFSRNPQHTQFAHTIQTLRKNKVE